MTTLILADEIHLNALELRLAEEEIRLEEYLFIFRLRYRID